MPADALVSSARQAVATHRSHVDAATNSGAAKWPEASTSGTSVTNKQHQKCYIDWSDISPDLEPGRHSRQLVPHSTQSKPLAPQAKVVIHKIPSPSMTAEQSDPAKMHPRDAKLHTDDKDIVSLTHTAGTVTEAHAAERTQHSASQSKLPASILKQIDEEIFTSMRTQIIEQAELRDKTTMWTCSRDKQPGTIPNPSMGSMKTCHNTIILPGSSSGEAFNHEGRETTSLSPGSCMAEVPSPSSPDAGTHTYSTGNIKVPPEAKNMTFGIVHKSTKAQSIPPYQRQGVSASASGTPAVANPGKALHPRQHTLNGSNHPSVSNSTHDMRASESARHGREEPGESHGLVRDDSKQSRIKELTKSSTKQGSSPPPSLPPLCGYTCTRHKGSQHLPTPQLEA